MIRFGMYSIIIFYDRYCRGVVGVVDIPSIVLEPTHNKQSFADEKEYHFLLKNMGEYMRQYWSDAGIENYVKEFWETYGYRDDQLDRPPSNDSEVVKRRQAAVPMLIQCDKCLKWRRLPYAGNTPSLTQAQLETWRCSDNTDVMNNTCSTSEKLEIIPEGELKQKPQATNTQNRTSGKVTSPPPTSSSSSLSLTTRSSGTNKRISNGEISSTTAVAVNINNSKTRSSRSNIVPTSITPQKRSIPQSRSLSAKSKATKKRKPLSSQRSKTKTRDTKTDDEEQEEEEEEEEEKKEEEEEEEEKEEEEKEELPSPVNRRTRGQTSTKPSKIVQKTPPPTPTRSSRSSKKTSQQTTPSDSVTSTNNVHSIDDDTSNNNTNNNNENISHNDTNINGRLPPPTIGARVMAMYQGAQRTGKVLSVNDKRAIFKMRFDEFPTAEFDYSFSYKSPAWSYVVTPSSSSSSSITTETTEKNDSEPVFSIVRKFKALIKFMLPPDWDLTREQITSMSYDELSRFDVELFMQSYREKMTQIVEQRKADEARWRASAQRIQAEVTELLNLTGMPIPIDSSMDDFERHVQDYITQAERRHNASS
ncbi:unnamed protein product [Rotaria sp. Silwood1]|nr:unnamed protein product [Rotaria sp. Silwood1]